MTLEQALNIPKDLKFQEGGHEKYYRLIIKALGYEDVKKCIPFSIGELKKAYRTDKVFNNLPIKKWDYAAGFHTNGSRCEYIGSGLTRLYGEKYKVDTFSCCTGVCILKEAAKMWVEEERS